MTRMLKRHFQAERGMSRRDSADPPPLGIQNEIPELDRVDIHKYPAKMLARIVREILRDYVKNSDVVLDQFCGSGTVMAKCKARGIWSVGSDINRLPVLLSTVKIADYDFSKLEAETARLLDRIKRKKQVGRMPEFRDKDYWFNSGVQRDIARILSEIDKVPDVTAKNFFKVCLSSIIRSVSNADPHIPPPVYSKRMREIRYRRPNTKKAFENRVWRNIKILKKLRPAEQEHPLSGALAADARWLPYRDSAFDAVITSPPYIDAQKYVRTFKLETFWLELLSSAQVDKLARTIIGTDQVGKGNLVPIDGGLADSFIQRISKRDASGWRSRVVHEFLTQIESALSEVKRVLKPGGIFALVVGDNNVAGIRVPIHTILIEFALRQGMTLVEKRRDAIKYRGFMLKRHLTAGIIRSEWILVFRNCPEASLRV